MGHIVIPHRCTKLPDCFGCRIKTIQLRSHSAFRPHYNNSVGQYVDTELSFTDALKRCAESNTIVTGTEHVYEMRDPAELARQTPFPDHDDIINDQSRVLADRYR
jgi:hypothetical protein